jgi:hypothetical protein
MTQTVALLRAALVADPEDRTIALALADASAESKGTSYGYEKRRAASLARYHRAVKLVAESRTLQRAARESAAANDRVGRLDPSRFEIGSIATATVKVVDHPASPHVVWDHSAPATAFAVVVGHRWVYMVYPLIS